MGKSSLYVCFYRMVAALNEIATTIIKWPSREEKQLIKEEFLRMARLPGVVGAIDGTYVPIKAPVENPRVYINRKRFHGITLQVICKPNLAFSDCYPSIQALLPT